MKLVGRAFARLPPRPAEAVPTHDAYPMTAAPNIDPRPGILDKLTLRKNPPPDARHGDEKHEIPPQIIVTRQWDDAQLKPRMKKRFVGALTTLQAREQEALYLVSRLQSGQGKLFSILGMAKMEQEGRYLDLEFDFRGLDLLDWLYLCRGATVNPFGQVKNCLVIAREMLKVLKAFHEANFVHCDIKLDNFCIPPRDPQPAESGTGSRIYSGYMKPSELCLIDLGFALLPDRDRRTVWRAPPTAGQTLGEPLYPRNRDEPGHPPYISPRFVAAAKQAVQGNPKPFQALDWRIDLYSLGWALENLDASGNPHGDSNLLKYWKALPEKLKSHDREDAQGTPPHQVIIQEIEHRLNAPDTPPMLYEVNLNQPYAPAPNAAAITREETIYEPGTFTRYMLDLVKEAAPATVEAAHQEEEKAARKWAEEAARVAAETQRQAAEAARREAEEAARKRAEEAKARQAAEAEAEAKRQQAARVKAENEARLSREARERNEAEILEEAALWREAGYENTIKAYRHYCGTSRRRTYEQEAQKRIAALSQKARDARLAALKRLRQLVAPPLMAASLAWAGWLGWQEWRKPPTVATLAVILEAPDTSLFRRAEVYQKLGRIAEGEVEYGEARRILARFPQTRPEAALEVADQFAMGGLVARDRGRAYGLYLDLLQIGVSGATVGLALVLDDVVSQRDEGAARAIAPALERLAEANSKDAYWLGLMNACVLGDEAAARKAYTQTMKDEKLRDNAQSALDGPLCPIEFGNKK